MRQKNLKRRLKRLLSFVLSLAMIFTLMISTSIPVYAMGITVKVVNDNTEYTLDVEPSATIEDVKNQLVEKTGISFEQQILKYNDQKLKDDRTLADYNIQKNSILTLEKEVSSGSNYHDTYAILVSVPDAWRNSGGAKIWSSDLGINSYQDLEMVDESRCLYGLKYTGTLPDSFEMHIKGNGQEATITSSNEIAQSKYYYIANGGEWITGNEENPNSLPDLSNLNNPQYKIFALVPSEYANDIGLYSWVTGGNGFVGWPGSSMTRLQEDGNGNVLFGGNVNGTNETNIIFNGKSASGNGWQTNDIYNVSPGENEAVYFKLGLDNGNYSSIERIDFKQILPSMITLSDTEYTYDGTEKTPSITVKDGDSVLTAGTDYTISGTTNATELGEYTVKITGTRTKYIGSVDVTWKIVKKQEASTTPDVTITDFEIPTSINMDEALPNPRVDSDKYSAREGATVDGLEIGWCREDDSGWIHVNDKSYSYIIGEMPDKSYRYGYLFGLVWHDNESTELPDTITVSINGKIFMGYLSYGTYYGVIDFGDLDENGNFSGGDFEEKEDTWSYSVKDNIITASCNGECGTAGAHTAQLTLSVSDVTYSGKAYDGASVENNITSVTGATAGSIKYAGRAGTTYAESTTAPTNAGKYTASVTINEKTATANFEITKATIKPSVTLDSWIYGGTAATPKVDGNTGNADVTYAYKTKGADDSTYTETTIDEIQKLAVGQYTLKAIVAESTNYKGGTATCDFSITRTPIKNVSVTIKGWTYGSYDKNVNTPELGADSNPGNGDVTYTYYTDKDCTTKTTAKDGAEADGAIPMNAGTYYVKASVAETDNYAAGEATTSFVIKPKAITATVSAESKVYDGTTDAKVTATVDTGVKGESFTISGLKGTFSDKNVGSGKTVTVDLSHANATAVANTVVTNYKVSYPQTVEADITPCPVELTWSETELTYTGTEQSVTAIVKNAVKGDSFTLTYKDNTQTEVKGNYTAEVTGLGNDNYTLENATGISQNWSISYLEAPDAEISGEEGNNGWHVSAVTLKPEDGYQISTDKKTWSDSLGYDEQGEQEVIYYLREIKTGSITDVKTASFKIDTIAPTGEITIGTNTFKELLNKVTFGHWFKDTVSVKIAGEDSVSGIDTIEYQLVGKDGTYDVDGKWAEGKSLSITDKDKYVIYARLTDKAGKQTIINSDGIVVFTDSTAVKAINYTKTTKKSVDAEVELNGNTVALVKNGETVLVEGTDYFVSADKITFSGDYLDTLSAGIHTLTVSYNPQGATEYIDGDKPVESQITVNVSRQTASLEITDALDKEYNGLPADVKYVTNSNAEVKVEYKVDGKWQAEAPTHAGSYEVRVSVPENGDYTAASDSKKFTISKTDARMLTMTSGVSTYGDAVNITATVGLVNGETYTGEIEYSYRLAATDDKYTAGIPSKAGSYETKATVKAFGDYNGASVEGTWTIKQKEVTVSGIAAKNKVYDGKAAAELDCSQAAFDGILVDDTLTVSATGTFADSNVASEKSVMITDLTLGGKDAGNYVLAGAGQQTITTAAINPKEVSVEITPNGGTYEGTITGATADLSGAVAGENPEVVLNYTGTANDGTVVNGTEVPTHAGTYTVTATVSDKNYSLKAEGATAEFTVAKAAPQLSVSAVADKNYGEEAFKLETINKGDGQKTFASDNDKVATVDENGVVTIVGAGKATLTVTLAETANYTADQKKVTITVKKIERKLTVTKTEYQVTYGDPAFKIAASAEDIETPIRFTSSNPDVAKVSDDGTVTIGNAGTTKINVSMAESNNYLAISKEVTVKVIPKDVTVIPNDKSKVYGEKDGELTCKTEGLVGEDILSDITLSRAEGEDVGSYDITASEKKDANPNYNVKFEKGTFTITQREVGLTWTDTKLTYNGKNQQPKAAATGLVEKDSCEVTVTGAQKDAGTYTATATGLSNPNYKLPEEVSAAYTIGAKEIAAVITPNGGIYEGTITPATAVLNGLVGEDNPEITLTYAGTANDGTEVKGTEVPTHAGTYKVTATISDDNYSLKTEGQAAEFTVAKAAPQLSVSAVADKNYGEEAFKLETDNKGDGQKTFASDDDKVATIDENGVVTIVGAGKATLTVTLAEGANYTADQKTVTITVKKIDHKLTVDKITYEVTYGDPEFKIAASAEDAETAVGFVSDNEDAAKVSADGTVTIGNVGTAKITVSMDESSNYLAVAKDVTVTVVPKKVTVTPDKISKVYGDKDGELTYKADGLVGKDTLTDITLSRAEGENAGNYTITAAQKDGANPNYEVAFNEGTFVIEPKNIETAEVTLGDALKYTGKEQTQEITKVLIDGIEVPADSYEVTRNTATDAGVHTLTITAKEGSNFTGTVTWTYVIAPTKPEQIKENADGKVEIGNGTLTIAVKSEGNAPKTSLVTGKAEIIDMLVKSGDITADELAQIANGASVDVVLTVKDASATISKEAKTAMKDTASKAGYTIGQYIDISLYKYMTVDGVTDEGVQLHSTADKIKIAVQIPENLINKDSKVERTYYIIRYHDGKAEIIEGTYDEKTQTFTFETDKFSDYAIAYKDVKKADAAGTSNGPGKSNTVKMNKTVKTGDTTNVFVYLIVLLGAFAVIVGVIASKRKRTNK